MNFVIPFDATAFAPAASQMFTGIGIANLNPLLPAQVTCAARDREGVIIPGASVPIPQIPPSGHYSGYDFPSLAGYRGTLECLANTLVSALALRFIGYEAFSTLPVIVK